MSLTEVKKTKFLTNIWILKYFEIKNVKKKSLLYEHSYDSCSEDVSVGNLTEFYRKYVIT